ncbi:GreA/GreB family elongation factor [Sphingomonas bacterium]|uniref:GreA/GreB family elongation factor n=1 Tax=Sphingomonas bacterium TaxID=1895847 RepID=UPI001576497A|nr:GreA/GreB family elongation factor [Sphingomonas bacterium]
MSVAFRRESDEEHKEPRFELPIAPGPNLVTPRGLALIEAKVAAVEAAVAVAADDEARDVLKRELRYWHTRRSTAELAAAPAAGQAGIGSRVTFRLNGAVRTIAIVGGDEAEPATGRIGFQAPLARAVIGAEAGERVDFNGIAEAIEIVAVEEQG